jgi:hypothetical protein
MITSLKSKYRGLFERNQWEAAKTHKENAEIQALKGEIRALQRKIQTGTATTTGTDGGEETRSCYHCGKKGHIKPDCPDLKESGGGGGGRRRRGRRGGRQGGQNNDTDGSNTGGNLLTDKQLRKVPPKENAPHTVTIDGTVLKWCGTCGRWLEGEKAHHTSEHVKGYKKDSATEPRPAGGLAAQGGDNDTANVRLVRGFLFKAGRSAGLNQLEWCPTCESYHYKNEHHSSSYHHSRGVVESALKPFQAKVDSSVKDSAGQE